MKQLLCSIIVVAVVGAVIPAWAEIDVEHYLKVKDTDSIKSYISGLGHGFAQANGFLGSEGKPLLYCAPPKLGVRIEQYIDILDREIADDKSGFYQKSTIALVLFHGLQRTFPCPTLRP